MITMRTPSRDEMLARFWKALGHPIRLRVLDLLIRHGPLHVQDLVEALGIGQGHLSNHLACLRNCGLVTAAPEGRYIRYEVTDSRVAQLVSLSAAVMQDHLDSIAACPVVVRERDDAEEDAIHAPDA